MLIRQSSATFTIHGEQLMNFLNKDTASADDHTSSSLSVKGPVNMPQMPSSSLSSSLPSGTHQMPAVTYSTLSVALPPPIPKVCFLDVNYIHVSTKYTIYLYLSRLITQNYALLALKYIQFLRWVSNYRQSNNFSIKVYLISVYSIKLYKLDRDIYI